MEKRARAYLKATSMEEKVSDLVCLTPSLLLFC